MGVRNAQVTDGQVPGSLTVPPGDARSVVSWMIKCIAGPITYRVTHTRSGAIVAPLAGGGVMAAGDTAYSGPAHPLGDGITITWSGDGTCRVSACATDPDDVAPEPIRRPLPR